MTTTRLSSYRAAEPSPVPPPALTLRGVTRAFAGRRALGPVSLVVEPGAACSIEGANGAGKTTLLRVAAGLLAPTDGQRAATGPSLYLRPGSGARVEHTVGQALRWAGRLTPGQGGPAGEALELVGLESWSAAPVRSLSSGMRARLTVAVALVAGPSVACLDEPTAHLDRAGVAGVAAALDALSRRGCALLLATHQPDDLAGFADVRVRLRDGLAEARQ